MKIYEITVKNSELPGLTEAKPAAEDELKTVAAVEYHASDTNFINYFGTNGMNQISNAFNQLNASLTNATGTNLATSTGTNAVKSVAAKKSPPPFDPMLDETESILLDYISLLGKKSSLAVNP